ncbi:TonB-dependent receptor [Xanthomonas sp. LMG 12462]|uniref:TonB-dependent receptor n=1 Tax=Xanthomonas sp. LMG 12462 TaxID=1591134 RepID=UPI001264C6A3|nr:TonB-dependent receptor [Xanthomonas sp. LMG 12462]KAB7772118.1 TonB-dependent receptor [Xanthomonas sp. LMG 12462]
MATHPHCKRKALCAAILAITGLAATAPALAGTVQGELKERSSGKPAAHAKVAIAGTALSAVTDAQGRFVIADVPAGQYALQLDYPGFSAPETTVQVADSGAATVSIALDEAKQLQTISVAANRYDASTLKMNSSNTVDVLSANDLEHTAVHNVAEALGLIAGINITYSGSGYFGGVDGAARGEGMFASVRGLPSEYNVNLIDGVTVAQGMPYSRSVQLSLLPPSGLQTIVANKTSTADMDGDAIGGTLDFRTPTAYDYKDATSGSVTVSGRVESRARDYGGDGLGGGLAGEFQHKFGEEQQFGFYASAYYDYRTSTNSEVAAATSALNDGSWKFLHANADGSNAAGYAPQDNLTSTGMNVGVVAGWERRYGGNAAFDWNVDDTLSVYARATYAYAKTDQGTTFVQLLPQDVSFVPTATPGVYSPNINRIAARFWYETNPEIADLATFQVGARKTAGNWTLSPNLFYSFGDNDRPDHIEIDGREDKFSQANFAYSGSSLMRYGSGAFPYPQLTPALLAQVNNIPSLYASSYGESTKIYSGQKKGGAKFDARYDFADGALTALQFGVKYSKSSRHYSNRDWWTGPVPDTSTLGDLGIFNGGYAAIFPGKYHWATPRVSEGAVAQVIANHLTDDDLDTCGSAFYVNNWNCNTMRGTEAVSAAYAMATFSFGSLEVVPGVRFEHTSIHNTFWTTPTDSDGNQQVGYFAANSTHYDQPLPSVFLTWRPDSATTYRAALWTSYTRPAFVQLGGGSQINISNGITTISQGNPDLKAITSTNLDLSGEWATDHGGFFSVAGFYKRLHHYIYDAGSGQANSGTSGSGTVFYQMPTNGGDGRVYGVEVSARQRFQDLPAPFDGLGVSANATRQHAHADLGMVGFEDEQMQSAPNAMANLELFYERSKFSVNLSYHFSSSYLLNYDFLHQNAPWDDLWARPTRRVDLHAGYRFDNGVNVDLSISNLTKEYSYWGHVGRHNLAVSDIVDAGMMTLLTVKYAF